MSTSHGLLDGMESLPHNATSVQVLPLPSGDGNTASDFHKYTLDWQEDHVRWLIDDEEVRRVERSNTTADGDECVIIFHISITVTNMRGFGPDPSQSIPDRSGSYRIFDQGPGDQHVRHWTQSILQRPRDDGRQSSMDHRSER